MGPARPRGRGRDARRAGRGRDGGRCDRRPGRSTPPRRPGGACSAGSGSCPGVTLLDRASERADAALHDHVRNVRIIEEKLRCFQIPATVVATNTGPVVTQYEVRPDARVKLSRIEGLADDLAMALAARSIRIEAPIPGRDVVGIEIPNHASEMVGFRARLRGRRHGRRDQHADLRARPRRLGQALRGGPRADAPPAHRRRHRLGQERLRQRHHHEHPHARPAHGGALRARRPQARGAGALRPHPAPAHRRHHGGPRGARRARLGGRRDGGPLQEAGRAPTSATSRPTTPRPAWRPRSACPTSCSSSTSSRTS